MDDSPEIEHITGPWGIDTATGDLVPLAHEHRIQAERRREREEAARLFATLYREVTRDRRT